MRWKGCKSREYRGRKGGSPVGRGGEGRVMALDAKEGGQRGRSRRDNANQRLVRCRKKAD